MREIPRQEHPISRAIQAETMIDRLIGWADPVRAVRRRHARTILAMTEAYTGARRDRRGTKTWTGTSGSPDADIHPDLPMLRERSRDLVRNGCIGGGAIHKVINNAVGTGLRLNARIDFEALGMTEDEAREFETKTERMFEVFARECDLTRVSNLCGLQDLVFRSAMENGDAFVILPWYRRGGDAFGTKIQLIEADRVSNPDYQADSTTITGGVELDAGGAAVAYHITTHHPGDIKTGITREWKRWEAYGQNGRRNVLHLYRRLRIDQHRGVPYLSPVIEEIKQLGRYTEAEVMAAVVAGMFTGFIETETGEGITTDDLVEADGQTAADEGTIGLGYGALVNLRKNEKIDFANPGRPNAAFDPFIVAVSRQIGMALEIPYEVLVQHFTASYSAARAALLEAWTFYRGRRKWLIDTFCQPVYETWMWEAVLSGYLYAPGFTSDPFIRAAYTRAEWIGPQQPQIDPLKEIAAAEKRVMLPISTREEECLAITGQDWESKIGQMRREKGILDELGITGGTVTTGLTEAGSPDSNGTNDDEPSRPGKNDDD